MKIQSYLYLIPSFMAAAFLILLVQPAYAQQRNSTTNNEPIDNANVKKVLSSNTSTTKIETDSGVPIDLIRYRCIRITYGY